MRTAMAVFLSVTAMSFAGCGGGSGTPGRSGSRAASTAPAPVGLPGATATAAQQHDIRGRIVAIPREPWSVRLDHNEVPGVMAAMTNMEYGVADPAILKGLAAGDLVEGRLEARSGGYVIVALKKR